MKRAINFLGAITLLLIIMAACDQNTTTDNREDLAELREDMTEVIQNIDEALAADDISEFKNKTDDAVSSLDSKIDDYLDEMDNADRRIDQNSRNQVIDMKQKKVEIEFKLALLEQDDYDWDDEGDLEDRSATRTDMHTDDDLTATGTHQPATGDMNRRMGTDRTYREIMYGPQLVDDLKADLNELRGKVQQFAQTLPQER